jgi:glycosyltransferase involved in cell wall biosynthesis
MANLWLKMAKDTSCFEIILAVDSDDQSSIEEAYKCHEDLKQKGISSKVVIQSDLPGTCVKGWNLAAKHATGKVLITISDDFYPIRNWDERILTVSDSDWINRRHVVMVNDGYVKDLCTLPIVTKARYDELGYFFYPGYKSMYCDTELTHHALQDGVMIKALHLVFSHYHPDNQMRMRDGIDRSHSSSERYESGRILFERRKALCFPKDI